MELSKFSDTSNSEQKLSNELRSEGIDPDKLVEISAPKENVDPAHDEIDPDKLIEPMDQFDGTDVEQTDLDDSGNMEVKKVSDVDEAELYSSREERLGLARRSDGEWSGEPGNSELTPSDESVRETMSEFGETCVKYSDGVVDFSPFSMETVHIDKMTPDRAENRANAYKAVANKWNEEAKDGRADWTQSDVRKWKESENLAFHECSDLKTVQFVPMNIHDACKHTGGCYEAKCRDGLANGGGFDD